MSGSSGIAIQGDANERGERNGILWIHAATKADFDIKEGLTALLIPQILQA